MNTKSELKVIDVRDLRSEDVVRKALMKMEKRLVVELYLQLRFEKNKVIDFVKGEKEDV